MSTLVVTNLSLGAGGLPNGSVLTDDIADNAITTAKIANANITAAKLDGAQSGSAPIYGARAWVNFNGTSTVAIRSSGNVSSITDNGTGDYSINFTTAMSDANYCAVYGHSQSGGTTMCRRASTGGSSSTTAHRFCTVNSSNNALGDDALVHAAIFR